MNKYWFRKRGGIKSKDLGWGWVPITWEGWAVITTIISLIGVLGYVLEYFVGDITLFIGLMFFCATTILIVTAILVSRNKTRPN